MKKLLIIDDGQSTASLCELFDRYYLEIDVVTSFKAALMKINSTIYDAVIFESCLRNSFQNESVATLVYIKNRCSNTKVLMKAGFCSEDTREDLYYNVDDLFLKSAVSDNSLKRSLRVLGVSN